MISFRRSGTETAYRARNWFGRSCDRLEDIELAQLLTTALRGGKMPESDPYVE